MPLQGAKIIYVTREIERALGTAPSDNYLIVSNRTPFGETLERENQGRIVLAGASDKLLGTSELLATNELKKLVDKVSAGGHKPSILVFKNTLRVESAIKAHGWKVLNPPAALSERVENKLSQIRWLGELGMRYLPAHASKLAKHIAWKGDPFIIQWAHGHTGDGTALVRTPEDLGALQEKFPERMARISAFIDGPSYTVNAVVTPERVLCGNVSYQITGLPPFTDNSFSTVGNDWGLAARTLSADDQASIRSLVESIGRRLQTDGWRGLFGVDVIKDTASRRIYLIEVNARQPASATFESFLQEKVRQTGIKGLTTFEAHLRALLNLPIDQDLIKIGDGAQIVQRVTKSVQSLFDDVVAELSRFGHGVISYQNTAYNADLLRIQGDGSIMAEHGAFNEKGREIVRAIKDSFFKIQL